jgi:Tol biopolymer transport system component
MSRYITRDLRRIALGAFTLTAIATVTACQNDDPIEPGKIPSSQGPASLIKLKPVFYFNGIMFTGTHEAPTGEIYAANPDGTGVFRLTNDNVTDSYPDVSPAGPAFAWARFSGNGQTSEIYSQNLDGTKRKQLTFLNTVAITPRYSPDGKRIAFTALVGTGGEIFTMNADGTGMAQLTFSGKNSGSPSWSPDGTKIAFQSSDNNGIPGVWVMNASGSGQKLLVSCAAPGCTHPKWNPVTDEIAIERINGSGIFVVDATSGGTTAYIPGSMNDIMPTWSKDGKYIIFASIRSNNGTYDLFSTLPMRRDMTLEPTVAQLTSFPADELVPAYSR